MEQELSFARKINFEPLLISIFFGIVVAAIIYSMVPQLPLIWIVCGILAFAIDSMLIYPVCLSDSYGYWKLDDQGIYYYDYSDWKKKIQAIFLPFAKKPIEVPYSAIRDFSIIEGKSILNSQYPLGGPLKVPLSRKIHYLVIQTDHSQIKLNCAWKSTGIPTTDDDIKRLVEIIKSKV
ncbi:hypothetical protein [Companilactobacillus sp. FL22-1]|uniref:hypothetical protein n=1 Tax=Companilactobacillus sp. FL22-1 TaxID=3373892 RepID=UPI003754AE23